MLTLATAGAVAKQVTAALGPIVYWLRFGPFKAAKTGRNRLGLPRRFESRLRYQSRVA
jgi:hypothetical protein